MKARIAKKNIREVTEEDVRKAIADGVGIQKLMLDYGVDFDTLIARFVKKFGKDLSQELMDALLENTNDNDVQAIGESLVKRPMTAPFANPKFQETQTIVTVHLHCCEDSSKSAMVSQILNGRDYAGMSKHEKIDCLVNLLTERASDQIMEQYYENPDGEFDLSKVDKTFGQAVLSRIHEQQFKRELQELFEKEDALLADIELEIKNRTVERDTITSGLSRIAVSLHQYETDCSQLDTRIERCRENHDWRLPQRISELRRKATEVFNKLEVCSGKNRSNQEKKYNSILSEIELCESEVVAAAEKLVRLQHDYDSLAVRVSMLVDEKAELEANLKAIDAHLRVLESQKKDLQKARFYLKKGEDGVVVATRNVVNDLVSDDLRPMTDPEIVGSIEWTDRLRGYEIKTGNQLADEDFVALVRILFLAPKQKQGYEIVYGEGTEYLADTILYFLGRK